MSATFTTANAVLKESAADTEATNALDRVLGHLSESTLDPAECWIWQGTQTRWGYGKFMRKGKQLHAHRATYELLVELVPDDMVLDHLCRNRACVNPDHLEVVTSRENVLRGEGVTAQNARKTHCPAGHPYDEANTYVHRNGRGRSCRACNAIRTRARRANTKESGQ